MQEPPKGMKAMSPVDSDATISGPRWLSPPTGEAPEGVVTVRKWARSPDELVELYSDEIWRFTSSQLSRREDAEDIVQEVFAVALSNFGKLGRVDDQRLWMLAVARKKVAGFLRKKYRRGEQPLTEADAVEAAGEASEVQEAVRMGIKSLPEAHAQALILKYVNGLSTSEVSRVMRKSLPATNSLLQRARESFREALGPAFAEYTRSQS